VIPKECKRLAEVDFPIAVVSAHSVHENAVRHDHPKVLHVWHARRPLAACRAILLALLLPDPCDQNCPDDFRTKARLLLASVQGKPGDKNIDLRTAILRFIGNFSSWGLCANMRYLEVSRGLVKAAHGGEAPLVVDTFGGGGSIPLEALRIGCEAFASDLNPVACLIMKVMLEDTPRHGQELAEQLRLAGAETMRKAKKELRQYYPYDTDGSEPMAYIWARTVRCESPSCGAEIPLVRSFLLCEKAKKLRALRYTVNRPKGTVEFEIFTPKTVEEVPPGTVNKAKATCLVCRERGAAGVLAPDRVRAQLRQQRGGADVVFDTDGKRVGGARLLAVVMLKDGAAGRVYRVAADPDYEPIRRAQRAIAKLGKTKLPNGLSTIPNEPLPVQGTLGFRVQPYGMLEWGDLFTAR
jgi:putative DNA methylase